MSEISDNKKPRIQVLQDRIRNLRLERDQLRAELHDYKEKLVHSNQANEAIQTSLEELRAELVTMTNLANKHKEAENSLRAEVERLKQWIDEHWTDKEQQWLNSVVCVCADFPNVAAYVKQLEGERDQWREVAVQLSRSNKCPNCDDVGFYVIENRQGEPEQCQCQWCYTTPQSRFNALAAYERLCKEGA